MEPLFNYLCGMTKIDAKTVLWRNVLALMVKKYGKENLTRFANEAHIGPGTATRMKDQATSVGVDVLEKAAEVFGVEPWQLLLPDGQPKTTNKDLRGIESIYLALPPELRAETLYDATQLMISRLPPHTSPAHDSNAQEATPSALRQA